MAKLKATPRGMSLKERLAYKSKSGPNGCIDYAGYRSPAGYGKIRIGGRKGESIIASRASYMAHKGPIPDGLLVLHRCDRPSCINIRHLFLGTNADNMRDAALKERTNKSSLTTEKVRRIRADTRLQRIIAEEHGISQVAVSLIKRRKNWRYVE